MQGGSSRVAGVTLPLAALRTRGDWGIGQIADLVPFAELVRRAGHTLVQILPPYELGPGETSPYGACTAFGLEPLYLTLEAIPELQGGILEAVLGEGGRAERRRLRETARVDFAAVRLLKGRLLRAAWERFRDRELGLSSPRAEAFLAFCGESRWARELGVYLALRESHGGWGWSSWPEEERDLGPSVQAMIEAPASLDTPLGCAVLEQLYRQWLLDIEWQRTRAELSALGVELMGDLPFIVGAESADVWTHRSEFRTDVSLGAPPDGFSADGQDWGLPAYDWGVMDSGSLRWIRERTAHAARLYDRFRLDHVVGYFRQWVKPPGGKGCFDPTTEKEQRARGEKVLRAILEAAGSSRVIAEDLGVIPPFVHEVLKELHLPGYRVLPWERVDRHYKSADAVPEISVASWSTHDTAPITAWWCELEEWERRALARTWRLDLSGDEDARNFELLRALYETRAELALVLVQELLFEKTRINTPGTVGPENWTYRLPDTLEALSADPVLGARLDRISGLVKGARRG